LPRRLRIGSLLTWPPPFDTSQARWEREQKQYKPGAAESHLHWPKHVEAFRKDFTDTTTLDAARRNLQRYTQESEAHLNASK